MHKRFAGGWSWPVADSRKLAEPGSPPFLADASHRAARSGRCRARRQTSRLAHWPAVIRTDRRLINFPRVLRVRCPADSHDRFRQRSRIACRTAIATPSSAPSRICRTNNSGSLARRSRPCRRRWSSDDSGISSCGSANASAAKFGATFQNRSFPPDCIPIALPMLHAFTEPFPTNCSADAALWESNDCFVPSRAHSGRLAWITDRRSVTAYRP